MGERHPLEAQVAAAEQLVERLDRGGLDHPLHQPAQPLVLAFDHGHAGVHDPGATARMPDHVDGHHDVAPLVLDPGRLGGRVVEVQQPGEPHRPGGRHDRRHVHRGGWLDGGGGHVPGRDLGEGHPGAGEDEVQHGTRPIAM